MEIKRIGTEEFDTEVKQARERVLVDFYADWCGPCQMLAPLLEEIAKEDKIRVYKVNVDEAPELAAEYRVMTIPTLAVFKDGEVVKKISGVMGKKELEEWIG